MPEVVPETAGVFVGTLGILRPVERIFLRRNNASCVPSGFVSLQDCAAQAVTPGSNPVRRGRSDNKKSHSD